MGLLHDDARFRQRRRLRRLRVKTVTLTARQPGEALFSRIVADYGEDGQPLRMAVERSGGVAYAVEFRY